MAVGTSLIALADDVNINNGGLLIRGSFGTMSAHGFKQLTFVNPYNGNTSTNHSWNFGCQNQTPTSSDNDFYFSVVRDGTEHVTALIQDSSTNVQMNFTGQHRCSFQGDYNTNLIGMIVITTGTYYNLDKSDKPSINDSIPIVTLSTTVKDKRVFGAISDKEDSNNYRKTNTGKFVSLFTGYRLFRRPLCSMV